MSCLFNDLLNEMSNLQLDLNHQSMGGDLAYWQEKWVIKR